MIKMVFQEDWLQEKLDIVPDVEALEDRQGYCRHSSFYCASQILCIHQHEEIPSSSKKIITH